MSSPEVDVADDVNLLSNEAAENEGSRFGCCRRRRRSDWFFVEPVLIAHCLVQFPVNIITEKYALDWFTINVFNASSSGSTWSPGSVPSPCDPNITDYERQLSDRVQSLTSLFTIVESAIWGVPALIVTILLGAGSDRLGRRFAILPPLLGIMMTVVVSYCVVRTKASVVFFLIGDFLYGCCGSLAAVTMTCFAYVADRTPAERRMLRITFLQMCMLAARIVSSIAMGPIIIGVGVSNVILIAFFISIVNFVYVFLFLRNDDEKLNRKPIVVDDQTNNNLSEDTASRTRSVDAHRTSGYAVDTNGGDQAEGPAGLPRFRHNAPHSGDDWSRDDSEPRSELPESRVKRHTRTLSDGVQRVISLFLSRRQYRVRLNVLMAAFVVSVLPTFDGPLTNLFEMNQPLCWTVRDIGIFTGTTLAICALGALVVMPLMKRCVTDWHIAMTASVAAVITHLYKFFVRDALMMYFSSALAMFTILTIPSIRSIMSSVVSDRDQGAVFGAIAAVEVLCIMLGTLIFNTIYAKTLSIASGFFFLVMAAFYAVSSILLLVYYVRTKLEARRQQLQHHATEPT